MLARQGKSSQEIADYLCKDEETIRKRKKLLFAKLKVHSIQEAAEVAFRECTIHSKREKSVLKHPAKKVGC
jgi:DNA-binding CsgD family transcriptional regulator